VKFDEKSLTSKELLVCDCGKRYIPVVICDTQTHTHTYIYSICPMWFSWNINVHMLLLHKECIYIDKQMLSFSCNLISLPLCQAGA